MKNNNMKIPLQPLDTFFQIRNLAPKTQKGYIIVAHHLEQQTGKTLHQLLTDAYQERKEDWEDTQLYLILIQYRNHLYKNYKEKTAKLYLIKAKAIFRQYKIPVGTLPRASTKKVRKSREIDYEDLPTTEMLRLAINSKHPILNPITKFISSSGLSKTDVLKLKVQDYIEATHTYHHTYDIYTAIDILQTLTIPIIPIFLLPRQKTGETYRAFCSPEAVDALNMYLLSREDLSPGDPLFKISPSTLNEKFAEVNDMLGFGRVNGVRRYTPQMLRSFHATQLAESGMSDGNINLLQGRKPDTIARRSYIRVKRETLKEEYIRALPFLVIEDYQAVKTDLEIEKEKNSELVIENTALKNELDSLNVRQDNLEKIVLGNLTEDEKMKLHKLL